jgi:hypothetical protein
VAIPGLYELLASVLGLEGLTPTRLRQLGCGRIQDHDTVCLGWLGHRLTGLPEQCDVLGHRLDHQLLGLAVRGSGSDDSGQVRGVR